MKTNNTYHCRVLNLLLQLYVFNLIKFNNNNYYNNIVFKKKSLHISKIKVKVYYHSTKYLLTLYNVYVHVHAHTRTRIHARV